MKPVSILEWKPILKILKERPGRSFEYYPIDGWLSNDIYDMVYDELYDKHSQ